MGKMKTIVVLVGVVTLATSLCEIAVGVWLNVLVLIADGIHNLSDCASLGIAYWAMYLKTIESTEEFSFGHIRAELVAALVNAVSLLALCFYITLDALTRFISPQKLAGGNSIVFIIVAAAGLGVNLIATIIFALAGEHHHGHSHGHGEKEHHHGHGEKEHHSHGHSHGENESHSHSHDSHDHSNDSRSQIEKDFTGTAVAVGVDSPHRKKVIDYNMRALFLHFLSDTIASVFVLITAILNQVYGQTDWLPYMDPMFACLIVIVTVMTTAPLLRDLLQIFMHKSPVDVAPIREKLTAILGVASVHELHIWQLVSGLTMASVHIDCCVDADFTTIALEARRIFHDGDIHSVTIQPEFNRNPDVNCCVVNCDDRWCCEP